MERTKLAIIVSLLLLLAGPAKVRGQFGYSTNADGASVTITNYSGPGGAVSIPSTISNLSVTVIGGDAFYFNTTVTSVTMSNNITSIQDGAFLYCLNLASVTIGANVTNIGQSAFFDCYPLASVTVPSKVRAIGRTAFSGDFLTRVFFRGNAPSAVGSGAFELNSNPTAYYLPGTTGWSNTFASSPAIPAVLWNPKGQSSGVRSNQFGFTITGTANIPVEVEACTNLASPVWTPIQSLTLTNGSVYFSDGQWTNYPARYYGLGFP
jgi:hypothetical protein